jgi:hypothetical protein
MSLSILINWIANLINTLAFPFLNQLIHQYVFLIYVFLMAMAMIIISKKFVETKGRTIEEVMEDFQKDSNKKKVQSLDLRAINYF